ncbi:MAG TPA: FKBP-type peptidyl-prolyl cis-trans isomerase [Tichowtungia sp.]|nr:FKBP-type peptidyl-prolyl cis-trans isomerase [Tichowtungia sp.]
MARQRNNNRKAGKKKGRGSAGQNRAETEAFLEKNRQKPDVVETPSGLQYTIWEKGAGKAPDEWSTVEVNQRILLVDGTVIKDTYHSVETDVFSIEEAIPGLKEGLRLMKEGGKSRFVVPPDLAWGKRGAGRKIGPNALLIFDIRLEKVIETPFGGD